MSHLTVQYSGYYSILANVSVSDFLAVAEVVDDNNGGLSPIRFKKFVREVDASLTSPSPQEGLA